MNLIYFIRLLLKNVYLIFGVGVLMAVVVYILTRNQPESYSSEMIVYTGLATGYNIESGDNTRFDLFGTNAQFDNLLNIIRSPQTHEETAIRLMAQHLMLEQPNKRYCSSQTWNAIHDEVPQEVTALVHFDPGYLQRRGYELQRQPTDKEVILEETQDEPRTESEPLTETKTVTQYETKEVSEKVRRYRSQPKYYTVKAGDYPVAIARKFNLTLARLKELNAPFSLPLHGGQRLVVGQENEAYFVDSVYTRQVPVEVEIPISSNEENPVTEAPEKIFDPVKRMDSIADNFDQINDEALKHVEAYEATVRNFTRYKERDEENYIYTTLQSSNPVYGMDKISKVRANRMQNSDFLKLSFESHDPGVCQQTLEIITQVFIRRHQSIKGAQTSLVSDYYRQQVKMAQARLDSLEDLILEFRKQNRIINYNEQTKFIAEQDEVLDRDWYNESAILSAAQSALSIMEDQLDGYSKNLVQREEIMSLREDLGQTARLIALEEVEVNPNIEVLTTLKKEQAEIRGQLDDFMAQAYQTHRSTEGIDMRSVLDLWLGKVVEVEESRARYLVKTGQKTEFMKKYDHFAPLGSELTKYERQIEIAQQEYLDHLHSLSLSLMKQKNNEQSSIDVSDEAYFPLKPNPSKRMFIIIAAFIAGLGLTAALIIFLEFIDNSIKLPQRASELTKNRLIGAYPKVPRTTNPKIDYPRITTRLVDMISQKIKLDELQRDLRQEKPFLVFLLSTRRHEGKTFLGTKLAEKFRSVGHQVLFIKPKEKKSEEDYEEQFIVETDGERVWDFEYDVPDNFMSIKSINELLRNFTFMTQGYQYIFLEIPALLMSDYPASLATQADMSLLVCRANRSWNLADDEVMDVYKTNSKQDVYTILNGCQLDHLEPIIGEIPKKRSWIRKTVKKIINFDMRRG